MTHLDQLRVQRGAEHLHHLGPRAIAEFLTELADECDLTVDLIERIDRWRRVPFKLLHAVLGQFTNGREFPPAIRSHTAGLSTLVRQPAS